MAEEQVVRMRHSGWGDLYEQLLDGIAAFLDRDPSIGPSRKAMKNLRLVNNHWCCWATAAMRSFSLAFRRFHGGSKCSLCEPEVQWLAEKFTVEAVRLKADSGTGRAEMHKLLRLRRLKILTGKMEASLTEHLEILSGLALTTLKLTVEGVLACADICMRIQSLTALSTLTHLELEYRTRFPKGEFDALGSLAALPNLCHLSLDSFWILNYEWLNALTGLSFLDLFNFEIENDGGVEALGCLTALSHLGLRPNRLDRRLDAIPPGVSDSLRTLTALTHLDLPLCSSHVMESMSNLMQLKTLYVATYFNTPAMCLNCLTNLTDLELGCSHRGYTKFCDISPLSTLTNLEKMGLHSMVWVKMTGLSSLRRLAELTFEQTSIKGGIAILTGLSAVRKLRFHFCVLDQADVDAICLLTSLTELVLHAGYVEGVVLVGLTGLSRLEKLNLNGNMGLTEQGMLVLSALKSLSELSYDRCLYNPAW